MDCDTRDDVDDDDDLCSPPLLLVRVSLKLARTDAIFGEISWTISEGFNDIVLEGRMMFAMALVSVCRGGRVGD
jgi:hypothetical protein